VNVKVGFFPDESERIQVKFRWKPPRNFPVNEKGSDGFALALRRFFADTCHEAVVID
jgi:hypothetical protein